MKIVYLLFLLLPTVTFAGVGISTDMGRPMSVAEMTEKDFKRHKQALSKELRKLIDDFAKWPKSDQEKIHINGHKINIDGLSPDRQYKYDGSLIFWIESRVSLVDEYKQRSDLVRCLGYLKLKK